MLSSDLGLAEDLRRELPGVGSNRLRQVVEPAIAWRMAATTVDLPAPRPPMITLSRGSRESVSGSAEFPIAPSIVSPSIQGCCTRLGLGLAARRSSVSTRMRAS